MVVTFAQLPIASTSILIVAMARLAVWQLLFGKLEIVKFLTASVHADLEVPPIAPTLIVKAY